MTEGWEDNQKSNIRTFYWTHMDGGGVTFQDLDNSDAWVAMRDGLDLRKWA